MCPVEKILAPTMVGINNAGLRRHGEGGTVAGLAVLLLHLPGLVQHVLIFKITRLLLNLN